MVESRLAPGPLTDQLGFSEDERARVRARLEALGVRALPYPFSSAMSVLSDCDGSSRPRYEAYLDAFSRLGLDFGDSTWLRWNHQVVRKTASALGFFSHTFSKGAIHNAAFMAATRTFAESVAEYHSGNIDHFHSLLGEGPRVVIVDCDAVDGSSVEIPAGPFQEGGPWRTDNLHLFGLLVDGECQSAQVVKKGGAETPGFRRLKAPSERQTLFALPFDPDGENRAPILRNIRAVKLTDARNVRRVVLLSCHSELLLERVAYLRSFNVEMNTITEHARLHFRNPVGGAVDDKKTRERLRGYVGPSGAVCGAISDDAGLIVSTDADDPASVCRVLPELFDLGLRFVVPHAANSTDGWDLLEVVSPTPTRSGGGGYWARRTVPLGRELGHSRQETFTLRMQDALRAAESRPGRVWPLYTHLGARTAEDGADRQESPDPYFDDVSMRALQNDALGISGQGRRMWFTRGSTLYDYALVVRSIAEHIRREGDTIDINSWRDAALGKILPCSPAQLYGVTFYVDDAATATVRLDGRAVETVSRNGADETGRQSVTVMESEIRAILFDRLSPLANDPDEAVIDGECVWRADHLCVDGAVTLPLHAWSAPSAQAFEFDAEGVFGVRLRTRAGGSFYFGDPRWNDGSDDASYAFLKRDAGRFVVPFHDLTWRASIGEHMPSHPLSSITLEGKAKFARLAFLRPRATMLRRTGFCVAGRVPDFKRGQVVNLGERRETVDQRGWFCFSQTPEGVYRLTTNDRCDRRGPLVEIGSDVVNFMLDRAV
jgi:hypothetical protein